MRKVVLTMTEDYCYNEVKRYVEQGGNFKRLCLRLGKSERTGRRMIAGFRRHGKEYFRHKNHDKKPATAISNAVHCQIINLYNKLYFDCNFKHFHELLVQRHKDIPSCSLSTLRNIFSQADILSTKAHKTTRRRLRQKDKLAAQASAALHAGLAVETPLLSSNAHPRREKSRYAGEIVFLDASPHTWFNGRVTSLHAAIDDSTGTLLGAWFGEQETLHGYYKMTAQILENYGIPASFHTDGRTVFEYKKAGVRRTERDTSTQFTYACKNLGIEVFTTSVAEAQGKVERLFGTLQSRLPPLFRLEGITTIEEANAYVTTTFLPMFNGQFASPIKDNMSVFEAQLEKEDINLYLAVLSHRIVDKGCCISYQNKFYRFLNQAGEQVTLRNKEKVLVIKSLDGRLFASCKDELYCLEHISAKKAYSYNFDKPSEKPLPRKLYIPDMRHPWKSKAFESHENYRLEKIYSFPEICYSTANYYQDI